MAIDGKTEKKICVEKFPPKNKSRNLRDKIVIVCKLLSLF